MSPQDIWQADQRNAPRVTLDYVQHRVSDFQDRNRSKLRRLFIGQLFVTPGLVWIFWSRAGKPLAQVAVVIAIATAWWGLWRLKRQFTPAPIDASAGVLDTLRYYRGELERQLAAQKKNWRDGLLVNLFAVPFLFAAYIIDLHRSATFMIGICVFVVALTFVASVNVMRLARRMRSEIAALDLLA